MPGHAPSRTARRSRAPKRGEGFVETLRDLLSRYGLPTVTLGAVFVVVLCSATLLLGLNMVVRGGVTVVDLLIVTLLPAGLVTAAMTALAALVGRVEKLERRLDRMAIEDVQTRTFRRAHFFDLARREWDRSGRHGYPMALLLVDVDGLRAVNDEHGEDAGDALLRTLVQTCRACVRTSDTVGRFGGEEFLILLTESDATGAVRVAERLRTTFERTPVPLGGRGEGSLLATVSIGVAARDPDTPSFDDLVARCEEALASAKALGRNRMARASGEGDAPPPTLLGFDPR